MGCVESDFEKNFEMTVSQISLAFESSPPLFAQISHVYNIDINPVMT